MAWLQRDEWVAPAPKAALQSMHLPVSDIFLHHTVTPVSSDPKADAKKVTNYTKYIDVPYTVMVHPDGTILTGRYLNGVPALGAHTLGHNSTALGIALIGNYVNDVPTSAAIDSIAKVIEAFVQQGFVTKSFTLRSHSTVYATACCGTHLKDQIETIYNTTKVFIGSSTPVPVPTPVPQTPQPPANNYPAYPGVQRRGSKGVFVRQFQQRLHDRGWKITVDGDFGPSTETIVKQFQRDKGLSVDGIVGPNTWKSIWLSQIT